MKRLDLLWMGIVAALLLMSLGLVPKRRSADELEDSYSASFGGKKAFFDLCRSLLDKVERSEASFPPPESTATLVVIGPAQYPSRAQWQMLYDWVAAGHSLVFAARWSDPVVELASFGVRIGLVNEGPTPEEPEESTAEGLATRLAQGELDWLSRGRIITGPSGASTEVSFHGRAQVTRQKVGQGTLVVVASDYIFSNVSLARGDNVVLAFRILELASPRGAVVFDEGLNAAGPPKVVGLILNEPFRSITLQLALLAVVFLWQGSRGFGPVEQPRSGARRSLTEHALALGNLHYRAGDAARVVGLYLEFSRRELRLQHVGTDELRLSSPTSGDAGESLRRLVTDASRAARNPRLTRAGAARLIRSLAVFLDRAERRKA